MTHAATFMQRVILIHIFRLELQSWNFRWSTHPLIFSPKRDQRNYKRSTEHFFWKFDEKSNCSVDLLRSSFGDTTPFFGKTFPYTFVFLNSTFSKSTASTYPSPKPNPNPCPVRSRRFSPCSSNNVLNEEKDERNPSVKKCRLKKKVESFICFYTLHPKFVNY